MQKKKTKWDRFYQVIDTVRMFAVCMLIVLLMFTFVLRGKTIVGESMYPTLKDGEQVFINVAASYLSDIKRFDIVVVKQTRKLRPLKILDTPFFMPSAFCQNGGYLL